MYRNNYDKSQKLIDAERREEIKFCGKSQPAGVERHRRKCMKGIVERPWRKDKMQKVERGWCDSVDSRSRACQRQSREAGMHGIHSGKCDWSNSAGARKD